jgi:Sec-independent protein translocase protein TatA
MSPGLHALQGSVLPLGLLDIGPIELLILAAAAVMLFGGDLPDMARRAGQFVGRLRASAHDLTRDIDPPNDIGRLPPSGTGTPPEGTDGERDAEGDGSSGPRSGSTD